jgi:transposase
LLSQWLLDAENSGLSEFRSCITAYQNWSEEILNSLDVPWSNGFTEGCNNKTKVLKRVCFGVRNFARFRNRILHLSLA